MELVTDRLDGILVAQGWHRVDGTNAHEFEKLLRDSMADGDLGVVIDCGGMSYISSAGLRAILLTAKTLRNRRMGFALCELAEPIREVFEISGFDKIIAIHRSRAAALAAVRP